MAREGQREANPSPTSSSGQASPSTPPPDGEPVSKQAYRHALGGMLKLWKDFACAYEVLTGAVTPLCLSLLPWCVLGSRNSSPFLPIPILFPPASPHQSFIFIPPTHQVCFQRANCLAFGGDEIAQSGGYLKCGAGGKPSPALRSGAFMLNSASDEILPGVSHR